MQKIRKDDDVQVMAGRDKGKRGLVVRVLKNDRLIVGGVNMVKKNQRPNPYLNQPGGIVDMEAPIHVSNVRIYNEETDKPDRVGIRVEDGKRARYFKSTDKLIDE
ncbi:MAG: 50S ribosomal protein L24 [Gammaproteobacteria bacterium]|nr:50S ribosomal protein L24 [Gammaproteobacteria bacterium]